MTILTVLALSFVLGSGAPWAQAAQPVQKKTQARLASASWYHSGAVVGVDAAKGKLRVKCFDGKVRTFSAKRTRIGSVEGKTIALADLNIGDEVSLAFNYSIRGRDAIDVLRLRRAEKK